MTDQEEVVTLLQQPALYAEAVDVDVVRTHGAYVFLGGDTALKIKRAVRYDYLDYSTPERRAAALRRELELNAPAAPMMMAAPAAAAAPAAPAAAPASALPSAL